MTQSKRQAIGLHEAAACAGTNMLHQIEHLNELTPTLGRFVLEDGFGNVLGSATTGYREWNLQVLAVLAAMGDAGDQSEVYLRAAIESGATDQEIKDVLSLCYLYAGAPRAVTAARRMSDYLNQERGRLFLNSTESVVALSDHDTIVWDSHGMGVETKGIPVVLIHALDMDHRFWREVFPVLAEQGRVITYDIRGHGHARGAPLTTSLDQLACDLRDLLDRLEIPVADVYGASYGGAIAQHVMLRIPERVRSMALIATFAKSPRAELAARATDAEQQGMEAQVAKSIIRWFLPESIAEDLWMVRYARNRVRRTRPEEWAAAWRAMAELDVTEQAPNIEMPVLVLSGTRDLSSTPELMKATAAVYKHSEFVSIEGGTHMMPMEQSAATASALVAFRNRVEKQYRLHEGH